MFCLVQRTTDIRLLSATPSMPAWQTHTHTHKTLLKGKQAKETYVTVSTITSSVIKYKWPTKKLNNIATGNLSTKNITLKISKIFSVWLSLHFPCLFWEALVVICCVFCKSVNIFVQKVILSIKDQQKLCYCPFLVKGRRFFKRVTGLQPISQGKKKSRSERKQQETNKYSVNMRLDTSVESRSVLFFFLNSWQSQCVGFIAGKSIPKSLFEDCIELMEMNVCQT